MVRKLELADGRKYIAVDDHDSFVEVIAAARDHAEKKAFGKNEEMAYFSQLDPRHPPCWNSEVGILMFFEPD